VKVLIVDEQARERDSLLRLSERNDNIEVVAEAGCGRAAIDAAGKLNPDVILLNVELPDMSGFELLRAVGGGHSLVRHHGVDVRGSRD
jgi:DNA-binding NarL/FixJ family response regulator